MSISRSKRANRKAAAEIRRHKCARHRVPNCDDSFCRRAITAAFYRTGKKRVKPPESPAAFDRLFYLIRHPEVIEEHVLAADDDTPAVEAVSAPAPKLSPISRPSTDVRRLTLRERIALGVPANA